MRPYFELRANDGARATIHLQGAHVTTWQPAGSDASALYLSERSAFAPGVAIRGGVPVIFPQFASEGPLTKHGFARTLQWALLEHGPGDDGRARARLRLQDNASTRALWPQAFIAELGIEVGGTQLQLRLEIHNSGDTPFSFTVALHSYLRVDDLAALRLLGLQQHRYRDSAKGGAERLETAPSLAIAGEVDRIYLDTPAALQLIDLDRQIDIEQQGFRDTVIWNPGAERAAALADLEPGGWQQMLCVEAATVAQPVQLAPGERWLGTQTLIETLSPR